MSEVEIFKESLDVSKIVMIITIIMTIISVTFSALTLAFQRSHNKKSVKPLCDAVLTINSNGVYFCIKNAGLGPMIIDVINIYTEDGRKASLIDFLNTVLGNDDADINKKNGKVLIAANEEKSFVTIHDTDFENVDRFDRLLNAIRNIQIEIKYYDIYDKEYSVLL